MKSWGKKVIDAMSDAKQNDCMYEKKKKSRTIKCLSKKEPPPKKNNKKQTNKQ